MKVRPDEQLLLALNAPVRPEYESAAGDEECWHQLQCRRVASWRGRPLPDGASAVQRKAWWKQAKKQHGELVEAAQQRIGAAGEAGGAAGNMHLAGLRLTKSWVEQHAPEIRELRCEGAAGTPGGGTLRHLQATVQGPDGDEEHTESIHYSPAAVLNARKQVFRERRREERAVLALADRPKRQRLVEHWLYEQETAAALAKEQAEMDRRLQKLSEAALQPFAMRSAGGHVLWVPASRLEGLFGYSAEPRIDDHGFYLSLEPTAAERQLARGCFLCRCVLDCKCCRLELSPRDPPPCPSSQCSAAHEQRDDPYLGVVPWCSHRRAFRDARLHRQEMPWRAMQRRWLASDGSNGARDALR